MVYTTLWTAGDFVNVMNPKTGQTDKREVLGIGIQHVRDEISIIYGFKKDKVWDESKDLFWVNEKLIEKWN